MKASPPEAPGGLTLIGRSSSSFTRVARIFAAELQVDYAFRVVRDLLSTEIDDYGGNPALRLPTLETPRGLWFGALNICRELSRQAQRHLRVVWPEDLAEPLLASAQELVVQAMATEVALIMAKATAGGGAVGERAPEGKMWKSLLNMLAWLEDHAEEALAALPAERDMSYLEVTLFCLVTHVGFREVLPVAPYRRLDQFCQRFATRPSAAATAFRFDA